MEEIRDLGQKWGAALIRGAARNTGFTVFSIAKEHNKFTSQIKTFFDCCFLCRVSSFTIF